MESVIEKNEVAEERLTAFANNPLRPLIEKMTARIAQEYRPEQIILYGSQATGKARSDSDVDLFIVKQTGESFITRCASVKMLLRNLRGKVPVSIIVLTPEEVQKRLERGDQFIEQILERGIQLL
ncbi:MAG: nucleotidyltransferase domain-containing protein [candidate division KSB1 bacterium]|nr:nucleotidyltransferase domain-containing protein [candidate division KSB1 bacterium]MDZ7305213.1 nucleotidyltransferase domain-containing protein [candidate division KSB1 bacterium]MDZ7314324.1 nucleotidyltransferase domain-containing protein [candidate division KSB1 bacterium]